MTLLGLRARLRPNASSQFSDPTLMPVVPGDVLSSVSRRHPARTSVDVWTAGNRVFRCAGTNVLREIIGALASGNDPVLAVAAGLGRGLSKAEIALVLASAEQVSALADRERADFCFAGRG